MRALVTGASGFIGRRLVMELVRRGHETACLVRPTSKTAPLRDLPVEFVLGDIGDAASLAHSVKDRDHIFHLAGVIQAIDGPAFETANARGTRNLVDACLRAAPAIKRFVFVSSIAAAGPSPDGKALTEDDEPRPVSAYGRSKLAAERIVLEAGARMPVTIVRPPNVLGPGSKEIERTLGLLRKRLVPALGDNRPRTSLVDVDDLVEALLLAAENPRSVGRTYFVTDGQAYAWPEITAAIAEELGVKRFMIKVPFGFQILAARFAETAARLGRKPPLLTREIVRAARDHFWIYDGSKIERELDFHPRYGLRESVRRAVEESRLGRRGRAGRKEEA
ncbi:MAG: NAD-dependent epimerase/dehydratase family protein [Acidobacteria bacterium]|nr:NAD-dependent epimerase/dehydratase family protein [Acidobacteriota bacterium]